MPHCAMELTLPERGHSCPHHVGERAKAPNFAHTEDIRALLRTRMSALRSVRLVLRDVPTCRTLRYWLASSSRPAFAAHVGRHFRNRVEVLRPDFLLLNFHIEFGLKKLNQLDHAE